MKLLILLTSGQKCRATEENNRVQIRTVRERVGLMAEEVLAKPIVRKNSFGLLGVQEFHQLYLCLAPVVGGMVPVAVTRLIDLVGTGSYFLV